MKNIKLLFYYFMAGLLVLVFTQNCGQSPTVGQGELASKSELEQLDLLDDVFIEVSKQGHLPYGEKLQIQILNPQEGINYHWYADDILIPDSRNLNVLEINGVTPNKMAQYYVVANGTRYSNKVSFTTDYPKTCKEIKDKFPNNVSDGIYVINPNGDNENLLNVKCMMSQHGGGWLAIDYKDAKNVYDGVLGTYKAGAESVLTNQRGPRTRDNDGDSGFRFDFTLPYQFTEFAFGSYSVKANAALIEREGAENIQHTSEIKGAVFTQTVWNKPYGGSYGDISFGIPGDSGPTVSFGSIKQNISCHNCITQFNAHEVYKPGKSSRRFRITWGESGPQQEGWFPWYDGYIFVR